MFDYFNFVLNCFINRNDDLFKKKLKMLLGRNFYFVWLIIEMFIINEKKIEKLGFGILKNCMI